ncbi:MAG: AAA family ATPase [Candidatus Thorarchaeota archaeon]
MSIHDILETNKHQIKTLGEIEKTTNKINKNSVILPLDQRNFDDVLEGGFYSGEKYVIFGANKTGKTQLCHQLCVQAYKHLHDIFGVNKNQYIYYFDTENTFRPERIEEILATSEYDVNFVLQNILISKIMSNSALLLALKDLEMNITNKVGGLLIIDTINNHFGFDVSNSNIGFQEVRDRFIDILRRINKLTNKYNLITILTSQIVSNFSKKVFIKEIPIGYQFLNHFFSEFLYLSRESKQNRYDNYVQLVNSLKNPEKRVLYKISSKGIHDHKI